MFVCAELMRRGMTRQSFGAQSVYRDSEPADVFVRRKNQQPRFSSFNWKEAPAVGSNK
jgi:hypothetical protein